MEYKALFFVSYVDAKPHKKSFAAIDQSVGRLEVSHRTLKSGFSMLSYRKPWFYFFKKYDIVFLLISTGSQLSAVPLTLRPK